MDFLPSESVETLWARIRTSAALRPSGMKIILKTAVGVVRRERLRPDSLLLLAKWSVNSRWCPNPQGEFIGCSEMSLEQQKKGIRSERRMTTTAEYVIIAIRKTGSENPSHFPDVG